MSLENYNYDGTPDGDYLRELVDAAPSLSFLIQLVCKGYIFRGFRVAAKLGSDKTGMSLAVSEVDMTVDPAHVPWDEFHTSLLLSIFHNRATNKHNAATLCRNHTDEKFRLLTKLHRAYPLSIADASSQKKQTWRSIVDGLAADFIKELEHKIVRGGGDLLQLIEEVLAGDEWKPVDNEHAKTIYYISGSVLNMANNRSENKKEEFASIFGLLKDTASSTREEAKEASLPYQRVQSAEAVGLFYPTAEFYNQMLKLESVFHNILKDKNVALFGPGIIEDIVFLLSKQDLGFAQFMPGAEDDAVEAVFKRLVDSYGNLRGKDFARKRNAKDGDGSKETTRATLGTIEYLNKLKKEKREKEQINGETSKANEPPTKSDKSIRDGNKTSGDPTTAEASATKNSTIETIASETTTQWNVWCNMKVPQLKATINELNKDKLADRIKVSGTKIELLMRLGVSEEYAEKNGKCKRKKGYTKKVTKSKKSSSNKKQKKSDCAANTETEVEDTEIPVEILEQMYGVHE